MPEASVDKDDYTLAPKNKIRFAKDLGIPPPTRNPVLAKNRSQAQLGRLVTAGPNARHHQRTLGLGDNVRHQTRYCFI